MIKGLKTHSFRKLSDFEVSFKPGSNILTGDNGAGKSTVFRAIRFALYGVAAAGCAKELLPTHGAKNCKVVLNIDDLVITRDLRNCTITKDGTPVAEGNTPCTQYMEDYLGMDFKAFNIFCLSPQGETQALLTVGATELNRRVEQYSGVDIIDKIIKATSSDISVYKGKLDNQSLIDTDTMHKALVDLECVIDDGKSTLAEIVAIKAELDDATASLRLSISHQKKINGDIYRAKELHDQAEVERDACELELNEAEKLLAELISKSNSVQGLSEQISELSSDIEFKTNANTSRDLEAQKYSQAKEAAHRLVPLADSEAKAKTDLELLQHEITAVGSEVSSNCDEVTALERVIKQDKKLLRDGICPTCERPHKNFDAELVHIRCEDNRVHLRATQEVLAKKLAETDLLNRQVRDFLRKISSYDIQLADAEMRRDATFERLEAMPCYDPAKINSLVKKRDDLVFTKRSIAEHSQRIEQAKTTVERLQRTFSRNSQKMADNAELASYHLVPTITMQQELSEKTEGLQELTQKEVHHSNLIAGLESDLIHISDEYTMALASNEKYIEDSKASSVLVSLNKLLRKRRGEFMADIWAGILARASHFVNETTSGWITEIGRDDKGNFTFRERGNIPCPIIGTASGAQAAFCGAAIRIGISLAMHGSNALLMLDEPTESMSEVNASKLASGLLALGGQTMLITHRTSEAVSAQSVIQL